MIIKNTGELEIWARLAQRYADERASSTGPQTWRSVTELIGPPKIAQLMRQHRDEIEVDVTYILRSIEGSALHEALASVADPSTELVKTRLYVTLAGHTISGEPDYVRMRPDDVLLVDFKRVKAFSLLYKRDPANDPYVCQIQCYAYLLYKALSLRVTRAQLHYRLVDWSHADARRRSDYPQSPLIEQPVELWPYERTEQYLLERIRLHEQAEADPQAIDCTPEERWVSSERWVLLGKNGRALPHATYDTLEQAKAAQAIRGGEIEYRPGISKRCVPSGDYGGCPVRQWCRQYLETIAPKAFLEEDKL